MRESASICGSVFLFIHHRPVHRQHLAGLVILGEKHLLFRPLRHSSQIHPALERPQQPRLDPAGLALRQMLEQRLGLQFGGLNAPAPLCPSQGAGFPLG